MGDRNKPIVIVGTHADEVLKQKQDPDSKMNDLIELLKKNAELLQGGVGIFFFSPKISNQGFFDININL